jgi:uroporphyrinogen decarboxylase
MPSTGADDGMTSRDRVLAAIEHRAPDRVPIDLGGHISGISKFAYARLLEHLGLDLPVRLFDKIQLLADPAEEVLQRLGVDFRYISANPPGGYEPVDVVPFHQSQETGDGYATGEHQHTFVDQWGITFRRAAYYYDMVDHPLQGKSFADVKHYRFPDPDDPCRWKGLREQAKDLYDSTEYAIVCALDSGGLLELSHFLFGFEDSFSHIARNDRTANYVLDATTDWLAAFWTNFVGAVWPYAHIIKIGDDYGMQDRLLMSPSMWRKQVKPRYARLVARIKAIGEVKVFHHSCGAIFPIIGDLAEIGVDILNPIQPLAKGMEPERLKSEYGDIISFHGGIDMQHLLPFGTPDEVRDEVLKRIEALAPGGGYIFAASHNIQADVPVENIVALFNAAREYGSYRRHAPG